MPKDRLYVRRFLNRPYHHGSGHIRVRVEDTSGTVGSYVTPDVVFELADCSRQVSLDFGFYSESARRNSLYKARLLADVTARFIEALEREVELSRRRIKEYRRPASPKADWMVNVCTRQAVPDFTEDHFEPLAEALDTLSPALGFDTVRRTVGATLTISAACARRPVDRDREVPGRALRGQSHVRRDVPGHRRVRGGVKEGYTDIRMVKVLLSLDDALLRRIDRAAKERGLSRSAFVAGLAQRELGTSKGPGASAASRSALRRLDRLFAHQPHEERSTAAVRAERDGR